MAIVYSIFPDANSTGMRVFKTRSDVRKYIADNNITEYEIIRHKTVPVNIDSIIDIINNQGGAWCVNEKVVARKTNGD